MRNWLRDHPSVVTGIVAAAAVAIIVWVSAPLALSLRFAEFNLDAFSSALAPLLVIAVLIERTIEVFFGIAREPREREIEDKQEKAALAQRLLAEPRDNAKFAAGLAALAAAASVPVSRETKAALKAHGGVVRVLEFVDSVEEAPVAAAVQHAAAAKELVRFKMQNTRIAFCATLGLGIVAAVVGIRVLELLLAVDATTNSVTLPVGGSLTLFQIANVLLTAGLLSGGADGFHHLTSVIAKFLGSLKDRAEDLGKPDHAR